MQYNPNSAPSLLPPSRAAMSTVDPIAMSAPPPQAMVDDDDILMDYEDEIPEETAALTTVAINTSAEMDLEDGGAAYGGADNLMMPEKVYVRGVDNMNTEAVTAWASEHFDAEVEKVEWIDDTSCNLIYATPAIAARALDALQQPRETTLPVLTPRAARPASKHPEVHLEIRIARPSDKKERGARERSRYYLFHPEEDRAERFERERRKRRPHSDSRDDRADGDYNRRRFDDREHSRRRHNDFSENMYDDDEPALEERRVAPRPLRRSFSTDRRIHSRRSRSRSPRPAPRRRPDRSRSPERDRRQRQRSPIELFPHLSGINKGVELFPEKAAAKTTAATDIFPTNPFTAEANGGGHAKELFPDRALSTPLIEDKFHYPTPPRAAPQAANGTGMWKRDLGPRGGSGNGNGNGNASVELFPHASAAKKPSLAERITFPRDKANGNGSISNGSGGGGFKIRGLAAGSDDLFAEKLRSVKGDALYSDSLTGGNNGGGGGRRRGRRATAQDHFG